MQDEIISSEMHNMNCKFKFGGMEKRMKEKGTSRSRDRVKLKNLLHLIFVCKFFLILLHVFKRFIFAQLWFVTHETIPGLLYVVLRWRHQKNKFDKKFAQDFDDTKKYLQKFHQMKKKSIEICWWKLPNFNWTILICFCLCLNWNF